jgi:hypothetical protein
VKESIFPTPISLPVSPYFKMPSKVVSFGEETGKERRERAKSDGT